MVESRARSVVKALSWRVMASSITGMIVWWLTGRLDFAGSAGLIDLVLKLVMYYGHERVWQQVPFGRDNPPEFEI